MNPEFVNDDVNSEGILNNMLDTLDKVRYGSSYANIFIHNSKLYTTSSTNIYTNVLLCCPLYYRNKWHSVLAITNNDDPNLVIANSNSFYWEDKTSAFALQNKRHRIYDRLVYTYHRMRNYNKSKHIIITDECLLLANAFTSTNSGHELSLIFDAVSYYRTHSSIKKILILPACHWIPNNYKLLNILLGTNANKVLFEIQWNKVYRLTNVHVPRLKIIQISLHASLIEELKQHVIAKAKYVTGSRVIILKTHRDKNVISVSNQLICENLLQRLQGAGWIIINPEVVDVLTICATLMTANSIVFSYGSILYTHMVFFNPAAKLKWICVGNDKLTPAYSFVSSRRPQKIYVPNRNLDGNSSLTNSVFDQINNGTAPTTTIANNESIKHIPIRSISAPPFFASYKKRTRTRTVKQIATPTVTPTTAQIAPKIIATIIPAATPAASVSVSPQTKWILGDPHMVTNSGLLQEHFFVHSLLELMSPTNKFPFIAGVNHQNATCMVEFKNPHTDKKYRKIFTVMFPMKRVNIIKSLWQSKRTSSYFFRGLIHGGSQRKQWIKNYMNKDAAHVEHSLRGRGKDKYVIDMQYYELMCKSNFVLCPIDIYPWSYRLIEAVLCRCIPILNDGDNDILLKKLDLKYYKSSEHHVWREDWIDENLKKVLKTHTFSDPNHEIYQILNQLK